MSPSSVLPPLGALSGRLSQSEGRDDPCFATTPGRRQHFFLNLSSKCTRILSAWSHWSPVSATNQSWRPGGCVSGLGHTMLLQPDSEASSTQTTRNGVRKGAKIRKERELLRSQELTTVRHENRCSVMVGEAEGRGLINSREPTANQAS